MDTMIHPNTGATLRRDVRKAKYFYKGETVFLDVPGWYPVDNDNGIFTCADVNFHGESLKHWKEDVEKKFNGQV